MIKNISNLGDAAVYCDFGIEVNKSVNSEVIKYFKALKKENVQSINNLTPSYNKLIVSYDLRKTNFEEVKKLIENLNVNETEDHNSTKIEIPVCCDDQFSLDIKRLEEKLNISRDKILENFFSKEYFCYMTGFIAGMPFLGDLNENMRVPRLETPRVKVPKGSVALTEQFANIYTFESPGGWNILGNTPVDVFDNSKELEPNLINPGDIVVFKQINLEKYNSYYDK